MINCKRLRSCLCHCFCTFQICGIDDDGDDGDCDDDCDDGDGGDDDGDDGDDGEDGDDEDDDGDEDDDDDDDIYYDEVSVCLFVTKKEHFLLGVACNHL